MMLTRDGRRSEFFKYGDLGIFAALMMVFAFQAYSIEWDRKAAQEALLAARKMREELSLVPSPPLAAYTRCVKTFERVFLKDPHYSGSDDAIYEAGEVYREMGERFGTLIHYRNAAKMYRFLARDYGGSPRCPDALLHLGDLLSGPLEDEKGAQEAYDQLRSRFSKSKAAASLTLKKNIPLTVPSPAPSAAPVVEPTAVVARPPSAPAQESASMALVQNIRHWSTSDYTRVIIDMDTQTGYSKTRLSNPDRIFFDISNAKLNRDLLNRTVVVADTFLKQVRVGQNRLDVVRVVLDFATIADYSVFELYDPFRIVVDIHGKSTQAATAKAATPDAPAATRTKPREEPIPPPPEKQQETATRQQSNDDPVPASKPEVSVSEKTSVIAQELPAPLSAPRSLETPPQSNPPPDTVSAPKPSRSTKPEAAPTESASAPKTAAPTSRGDRTLTRMLGLKIGRIVIDPGHGGHDTGTIGHGGLMEKDLVLQVAHDLKKMLTDKLGAEVIMTREDDTFISLEERTAVANQARADLFISIHANSSMSRITSGVETYYLNFARTEAEREVAARENATTVRNISDLQNLVRKIAQADKSAESRELAAILQRKLFGGARQLFPTAKNRGVRTAPFVVLIGANMPSVLAEVAFISNPRDERVLRELDNRFRLAQALFAGIEGYMKTLGSDVAQAHAGSN